MARRRKTTLELETQGLDGDAGSLQLLALDRIRDDENVQSRSGLNQKTVESYADAFREGERFPPVVVFYDGDTYWLSDGFHRYAAADLAGVEHLQAEVRSGGFREALFHSLGSNHDHGLPRTDADKWKSVSVMVRDDDWSQWSNNAIAEACHVSSPFVAKVRAACSDSGLKTGSAVDGRTYIRAGKKQTMRTHKIGAGRRTGRKNAKAAPKKGVDPVDDLASVRVALEALRAATARKRSAFLVRALEQIDPFVESLRAKIK